MTDYHAVRYQASSPDTKVLGASLLIYTTNLRAETIQPILQTYHLETIAPDEWISEQINLNILRDIERHFSFEELVAIGVRAAELMPLPPELDSLEKLVYSADALYHTTVQNAPPNLVTVEQCGPQHYRLHYNIPVPPFATFGLAHGLMRRVKRPDQHPTLSIIDFDTPYVLEGKW